MAAEVAQPTKEPPAVAAHARSSAANGVWGMVALLATEGTLFAVLIVSYFYLRFQSVTWPPRGVPEPALVVPIVLAAVLVASTLPMLAAAAAARRGRCSLARGAVAAAFLVQSGYLAMQLVRLVDDLDVFTPQDHAYGSIYYVLLGSHHRRPLAAREAARRPHELPPRGRAGGRALLGRHGGHRRRRHRDDRLRPMTGARLELLLWYALGGAALAWTAQLVLGAESEELGCTTVGMRLAVDPHPWHVALTVACGAVAASSAAAAVLGWRAVRRGAPDRRGRLAFMAVSALLANALFLAVIVLGGVGASFLETCAQS
jgi:uncharacterized membrane protein YozB (DUF420 family)